MIILRIALFLGAYIWATAPGKAAVTHTIPPDDCIDSVHLSVVPVQCHGLRNGIIRVDAVFGGTAPFYYSLDGISYSTRPEFDHLWPGVYEIWIRDDIGCERRQTVLIHEPEEITVQLNASDTLIPAGAIVDLSATVWPAGTNISAINWRPPVLFQTQDTLQQSISLSENTTIAIEIRTSDQCVARDQIDIQVERNSVYIPNVFKPGSNQDAYFTVFSDEALRLVLELQVYHRNGGLVFERRYFEPNDPQKGWNGKWGDRYVQPGVYAWTALLQYGDGQEERKTGTVTVVR